MAATIVVTPSLEGTGNLQTQNVNVIVSGDDSYQIQLGVPPASANPNVTIVHFGKRDIAIEFINGALGYDVAGNVLSGLVDVSKNSILQTKYVGGYWLFI